jgi:ATP-dependent exoDNAse (exonuclease V) beta subunit
MPSSTFNLLPEQQKVIAHRGRHLQAIACAGVGKTEAIPRRVTSLVDEGTVATIKRLEGQKGTLPRVCDQER